SGVNWWNQLAGALSPVSINDDFLIGGTATSAAKFSYTGIQSGNTIASASGNLIVMPNNGWGGQVGIGTTTPNQALDVRSSSIFGNQQAFDITGVPNRSKIIYSNEVTTTTANDFFLAAGSLEVNPAGATSRSYLGALYNVVSTSTNAQNFTGQMVGVQGQVSHRGTGTLTTAKGTTGYTSNNNIGTITNAFAGKFGNDNASIGTITNGYGVYIASATNGGGGTYSNNYGLYVEDQSLVGSTSNYNLYSAGGGSHNYLAGNLGIGTTAVGNGQLVVNQTNFAGSSGDIFAASASGTTKFVIANSGTVTIGNSTDGLVFSPTGGGPTYSGTARPTKKITLSPEYAGAVLTASGSAAANGSMTSDASPSANFRTYYEWSSTQVSLNDYVVAVRVTLPADFGAWNGSTSMQISYNTESSVASTNKLDVFIYNPSTSTSVPVVYRQANVSTSWTTLNIANTDLEDSPAWNTAGQTATIYLKMYASGTVNKTRVGDITLNYLSKF
nr:hypothetical protein [Candidatus Levybacteria bacterium]